MAYNDHTQDIIKGQALNLAVTTACSVNKADCNEYIIKQFLRYVELIKLIKKADQEQLANAIRNPSILKLCKDLENELRR